MKPLRKAMATAFKNWLRACKLGHHWYESDSGSTIKKTGRLAGDRVIHGNYWPECTAEYRHERVCLDCSRREYRKDHKEWVKFKVPRAVKCNQN